MQLFHEIYGNYYNTIAAILDQAIRSKVSVNEIEKLWKRRHFVRADWKLWMHCAGENPVRIPKPEDGRF